MLYRAALAALASLVLLSAACLEGRRIDVSRMLGLSRLSQPVALEPAGQGVAVVLRGGRVLGIQ